MADAVLQNLFVYIRISWYNYKEIVYFRSKYEQK